MNIAGSAGSASRWDVVSAGAGANLQRGPDMPHSYTHCLFHCVFSTHGRRPLLTPSVQERLWAFMGGIAREQGFPALAVGGTDNHVHVLLSLPPTRPLAKALQLLKGDSSRWLHDRYRELATFAWQAGYGAFSIGISQLDATRAYIARQAEHHRRRTFEEEFRAILKRHGIEYDERHVFG